MRSALDRLGLKHDKHYLLTAATGAFNDYLANTEMSQDQKYLDFVNLMTYDFCEPDADTLQVITRRYSVIEGSES